MSTGNWLGIIGVVATILVGIWGIWYTKSLTRRSERKKRLVLDVGPSVPLFSIIPATTGIKLSIVYEKEGVAPVPVQSLYLTFVRIGNLGREPIRAEDIAVNDPFRLTVQNSPLLDIATVETVRDVSGFELEPVVEAANGDTHVGVKFAFLDYQDGALIRILTKTAHPHIAYKGTIIGMPQGAERKNYFESAQTEGCWTPVVTFALIMAAALILPVLVNRFHWNAAWIAFGVALITTITATFYVKFSVDRRTDREYRGEWPDKLSLPYWFSETWERRQRERMAGEK